MMKAGKVDLQPGKPVVRMVSDREFSSSPSIHNSSSFISRILNMISPPYQLMTEFPLRGRAARNDS